MRGFLVRCGLRFFPVSGKTVLGQKRTAAPVVWMVTSAIFSLRRRIETIVGLVVVFVSSLSTEISSELMDVVICVESEADCLMDGSREFLGLEVSIRKMVFTPSEFILAGFVGTLLDRFGFHASGRFVRSLVWSCFDIRSK